MNLLEETKRILTVYGKTGNDVLYVMTLPSREGPSISFSWEQFVALADFEYDNGFGGAEINLELKIVGSDWWLERSDYDGSEWWDFKTMPTEPAAGWPSEQDLREG